MFLLLLGAILGLLLFGFASYQAGGIVGLALFLGLLALVSIAFVCWIRSSAGKPYRP